MNKKGFCTNCRFGPFSNKDEPCRNCVSIPSQFLSKEEITDADIPMGKKDRKDLIAYRKMWRELKKKNSPAIINFVENYDDVKTTIEQSKILHDFMIYKLEQKYFPMEVS